MPTPKKGGIWHLSRFACLPTRLGRVAMLLFYDYVLKDGSRSIVLLRGDLIAGRFDGKLCPLAGNWENIGHTDALVTTSSIFGEYEFLAFCYIILGMLANQNCQVKLRLHMNPRRCLGQVATPSLS